MGKKVLWVALFFVSGILYYLLFGEGQTIGNIIKGNLDGSQEYKLEKVVVLRIIDGDTVELNDSRKVRLLGVNTPEKGRFMSGEAINFTKQIEGKEITLEYKEKDKYGRVLGYITYEGENINLALLRNGFAHLYYYDKDKYFNKAKEVEALAREENRGIWRESNYKECLELLEFKYKEDGQRCTNREQLILENKCSPMEILIKDDATHEYLKTIQRGEFSMNFSCVFNDEGDSLFVWDNTGLLIFYRY